MKLNGAFFCDMNGVSLGEAESGDEREGDEGGGDEKSVLQGIVFGDEGGVAFLQVVAVDKMVEDAEDGDSDGAAELLEQAVEGGGSGDLIAGNSVEEGGGHGGDEETDTDAADDHGQDDEEHAGADVDRGEQIHREGKKEDA